MLANHQECCCFWYKNTIIIKCKFTSVGDFSPYNFLPIKILHISAVTKIVGGISLVHSILDFIPILIKMNLYRWVFIDINTRQFTFYTVMYID